MSAPNVMEGIETDIAKCTVNADVTITGNNRLAVAAIITNVSVDLLGLAVGQQAIATLKVSSVIVRVYG